MIRRCCLLLFFSLACLSLRGQKDVPFFETIDGDSVRLYLESASLFGSSRTSFTGKDCAKGYRCVRISKDGQFEGFFKDFRLEGFHPATLAAEGRYRAGKKEGRFVFYHRNGRVMTEGQYQNDEPAGEWKFNNVNGELVMTLQFDGGPDPRILYMYDPKAKWVLVKNGNGEARFVSQGDTPYSISGRVKSGLADGEWVGEGTVLLDGVPSRFIRKETYREGKMVSGKRLQSGRTMDVCCNPELALIFPTDAIYDLIYLEGFPIEPCPGDVQVIAQQDLPPPRSVEPVTDLFNFRSQVKSIIKDKNRGRQVGEGYNPTIPGNEESRLVMHFNTNESGRPVKTRLVSAFGREFYPPIKRALESLTKWQPNQEKLVLTVYIRMGVSTYSYRTDFSLD